MQLSGTSPRCRPPSCATRVGTARRARDVERHRRGAPVADAVGRPVGERVGAVEASPGCRPLVGGLIDRAERAVGRVRDLLEGDRVAVGIGAGAGRGGRRTGRDRGENDWQTGARLAGGWTLTFTVGRWSGVPSLARKVNWCGPECRRRRCSRGGRSPGSVIVPCSAGQRSRRSADRRPGRCRAASRAVATAGFAAIVPPLKQVGAEFVLLAVIESRDARLAAVAVEARNVNGSAPR